MFVDYLLNQGNGPLLERMLDFASTRHRLIAENVVNLDTPGYRQKDLNLEKFQALLRDRVHAKRSAGNPGNVRFDDIDGELDNPTRSILFHDGGNRSLEQLMTDQAKNALMHNLVVELLRKQFSSMEAALKERLG
jgi:flagellar basal-body rod protein FlgB